LASFANKNVGNGKAVTVSGVTLSGGDAGNYSVSQPSGLMADIEGAATFVVAQEIAPRRAQTLAALVRRWGATNVVVATRRPCVVEGAPERP